MALGHQVMVELVPSWGPPACHCWGESRGSLSDSASNGVSLILNNCALGSNSVLGTSHLSLIVHQQDSLTIFATLLAR